MARYDRAISIASKGAAATFRASAHIQQKTRASPCVFSSNLSRRTCHLLEFSREVHRNSRSTTFDIECHLCRSQCRSLPILNCDIIRSERWNSCNHVSKTDHLTCCSRGFAKSKPNSVRGRFISTSMIVSEQRSRQRHGAVEGIRCSSSTVGNTFRRSLKSLGEREQLELALLAEEGESSAIGSLQELRTLSLLGWADEIDVSTAAAAERQSISDKGDIKCSTADAGDPAAALEACADKSVDAAGNRTHSKQSDVSHTAAHASDSETIIDPTKCLQEPCPLNIRTYNSSSRSNLHFDSVGAAAAGKVRPSLPPAPRLQVLERVRRLVTEQQELLLQQRQQLMLQRESDMSSIFDRWATEWLEANDFVCQFATRLQGKEILALLALYARSATLVSNGSAAEDRHQEGDNLSSHSTTAAIPSVAAAATKRALYAVTQALLTKTTAATAVSDQRDSRTTSVLGMTCLEQLSTTQIVMLLRHLVLLEFHSQLLLLHTFHLLPRRLILLAQEAESDCENFRTSALNSNAMLREKKDFETSETVNNCVSSVVKKVETKPRALPLIQRLARYIPWQQPAHFTPYATSEEAATNKYSGNMFGDFSGGKDESTAGVNSVRGSASDIGRSRLQKERQRDALHMLALTFLGGSLAELSRNCLCLAYEHNENTRTLTEIVEELVILHIHETSPVQLTVLATSLCGLSTPSIRFFLAVARRANELLNEFSFCQMTLIANSLAKLHFTHAGLVRRAEQAAAATMKRVRAAKLYSGSSVDTSTLSEAGAAEEAGKYEKSAEKASRQVNLHRESADVSSSQQQALEEELVSSHHWAGDASPTAFVQKSLRRRAAATTSTDWSSSASASLAVASTYEEILREVHPQEIRNLWYRLATRASTALPLTAWREHELLESEGSWQSGDDLLTDPSDPSNVAGVNESAEKDFLPHADCADGHSHGAESLVSSNGAVGQGVNSVDTSAARLRASWREMQRGVLAPLNCIDLIKSAEISYILATEKDALAYFDPFVRGGTWKRLRILPRRPSTDFDANAQGTTVKQQGAFASGTQDGESASVSGKVAELQKVTKAQSQCTGNNSATPTTAVPGDIPANLHTVARPSATKDSSSCFHKEPLVSSSEGLLVNGIRRFEALRDNQVKNLINLLNSFARVVAAGLLPLDDREAGEDYLGVHHSGRGGAKENFFSKSSYTKRPDGNLAFAERLINTSPNDRHSRSAVEALDDDAGCARSAEQFSASVALTKKHDIIDWCEVRKVCAAMVNVGTDSAAVQVDNPVFLLFSRAVKALVDRQDQIGPQGLTNFINAYSKVRLKGHGRFFLDLKPRFFQLLPELQLHQISMALNAFAYFRFADKELCTALVNEFMHRRHQGTTAVATSSAIHALGALGLREEAVIRAMTQTDWITSSLVFNALSSQGLVTILFSLFCLDAAYEAAITPARLFYKLIGGIMNGQVTQHGSAMLTICARCIFPCLPLSIKDHLRGAEIAKRHRLTGIDMSSFSRPAVDARFTSIGGKQVFAWAIKPPPEALQPSSTWSPEMRFLASQLQNRSRGSPWPVIPSGLHFQVAAVAHQLGYRVLNEITVFPYSIDIVILPDPSPAAAYAFNKGRKPLETKSGFIPSSARRRRSWADMPQEETLREITGNQRTLEKSSKLLRARFAGLNPY